MWFLGLLLILFIIFIVVPLLRIGWAVYRLRRRAAEMFDGQYRRPQEYYGGSRQQRRPERKKKIDPGVGEYVPFEDLPSSPSGNDGHEVDFKPENQIEDVAWEDIK